MISIRPLWYMAAFLACTILPFANPLIHSEQVSLEYADPEYQGSASDSSLPQDTNQFVREVIKNELDATEHDQTLWRHHFHREDEKNNYDRDVIETKEGQLARTLLLNGKPLTAEQLT